MSRALVTIGISRINFLNLSSGVLRLSCLMTFILNIIDIIIEGIVIISCCSSKVQFWCWMQTRRSSSPTSGCRSCFFRWCRSRFSPSRTFFCDWRWCASIAVLGCPVGAYWVRLLRVWSFRLSFAPSKLLSLSGCLRIACGRPCSMPTHRRRSNRSFRWSSPILTSWGRFC